MKPFYMLILLAAVLLVTSPVFSAELYDPKEYQEIIDKRCTLCHKKDRIEAAIRDGDDMNQILNKMLRMGAKLTDREKKVLGTFWGSPTK